VKHARSDQTVWRPAHIVAAPEHVCHSLKLVLARSATIVSVTISSRVSLKSSSTCANSVILNSPGQRNRGPQLHFAKRAHCPCACAAGDVFLVENLNSCPQTALWQFDRAGRLLGQKNQRRGHQHQRSPSSCNRYWTRHRRVTLPDGRCHAARAKHGIMAGNLGMYP